MSQESTLRPITQNFRQCGSLKRPILYSKAINSHTSTVITEHKSLGTTQRHASFVIVVVEEPAEISREIKPITCKKFHQQTKPTSNDGSSIKLKAKQTKMKNVRRKRSKIKNQTNVENV